MLDFSALELFLFLSEQDAPPELDADALDIFAMEFSE